MESAAVIGPSGEILYETSGKYVDINVINIADGALFGYTLDGGAMRQYVVFENSRALTLDENEFISAELYPGDRRILTDADGVRRFIGAGGERVSGGMEFTEYIAHDGKNTILKTGDKLIAVNDADGSIRELPGDISHVQWIDTAGVYVYDSAIPTLIRDTSFNLRGLMDSDFNKITEALWINFVPAANGKTFIVYNYPYADSWQYGASIIDLTGKRLTARDYYTLGNISAPVPKPAAAGADATEYFLARYEADDGNGGAADKTDIVDSGGAVVFSAGDDYQVDWVSGAYAAIRVFGESAAAGGYTNGMEGIVSITDLKAGAGAAPGAGSGASSGAGAEAGTGTGAAAIPDDEWLLPPKYDYIWPEAGERYIIARMYTEPFSANLLLGETTAVFDTITGKTAFTGDFRAVNFYGYKYALERHADGGAAASVTAGGADSSGGIFYAETSTRKGYLNDRGEWIINISRFDTLAMDD
jgi:hypothetical protein